MGDVAQRNWFDDASLVRQFPWLYRQYARYCRLVFNRHSGIVRGGSLLFRLLGTLHTGLGRDYSCGVNCANKRIFLDLTDNRIFEVLGEFAEGSGERRILDAILKPGDTAVDLGANHGSFSLVAAQLVGPTGFVVAFEPQKRLAELIEQSLVQTAASPYKVFCAACGDRIASVEFYVPDDASGSAGVFKKFSGATAHKKTSVTLTTLDDSLRDLPIRRVSFLKIDVEGSEFDLLVGARRTIEQHRPAILLEVNPTTATASGHGVAEVFDLLSRMGYSSVCEIEEFPRRRSIRAVDVNKQRNVLVLPDAE